MCLLKVSINREKGDSNKSSANYALNLGLLGKTITQLNPVAVALVDYSPEPLLD